MGLNIIQFDIETSDLDANFGEVLVFAYKRNNEKVRSLTILDYKKRKRLPYEQADKYLLEDIYTILSEADIVVGHYSKRFDYPFIQTRLAIHNMPLLPRTINHIDTWRIAKDNLKVRSRRMDAIAEYLGLVERKASVPFSVWRASKAHDPKAIQFLERYCRQDVEVLNGVFERLKPIIRLPAVHDSGCPNCGSAHAEKRGTVTNQVATYQRFRCKDCGTWFQDKVNSAPKRQYKRV